MGNSATSQEILYLHSKRTNWGLAILAFEGPDHRRYQFQDGQLRTFKQGYYQLLEPVTDLPDDASEIVAELESQLGVSRARRELVRSSETATKVITLDSQIGWFAENYENGFQSEQWNKDFRGEGAPRKLKKHRALAVAAAQESFAEDAVRELLEAGDGAEVGRRAVAIIKATNLTRPAVDISVLLEMDDDELARLGALAADFVYGDGPIAGRLDRLVAGVPGMTWPGATALGALVRPEEHVCVRPSTARLQARWVAPLLSIGDAPKGDEYAELQAMNQTIRRALEEAGLEPRDLLDVTEFSRLTLRPAVRKVLADGRR